ncbi:aminoglycoside phosphotransferase family protein [Fodinicurvata sediminis]|uniref:aminoglycoside phosphotransferase family protein n=1 Tax=Fodinicurvata sediminis TaxID=1121832 RepID=UPI0003B3AE4E|nr:phosphotransferase [Fodinicurvata sediminis]
MMQASAAEREQTAQIFLQQAGWTGAQVELLAADASFRRYFRVFGSRETAILMDAPPQKENAEAFLRIAEQLVGLGLSAPRCLARDLKQGFLLLEDFGDRTFTRVLDEGASETQLYDLAVDTLAALHTRWPDSSKPETLPAYDLQKLLDEAALFIDWYLPSAGIRLPDQARRTYLALWQELLEPVLQDDSLPHVLVLRDYHVDNLMILPGRNGPAACGLLDFQDAVIGPPAYDLVSLLRDARRDVPAGLQARALERYLSACPEWPRVSFERAYWILGAQRNAKIIGIFTRLAQRDGKPRYLAHLPRLWRLLEEELSRPDLAALRVWFDEQVPASARHSANLKSAVTGVST